MDNLKKVNSTPFDYPWWYRKEFDGPVTNETVGALLTLKGINYRADVWLNGEQLANESEIVGTFVVFDFDITDKLRNNVTNVLALRIKRPSRSNDFPYGRNNTELGFSFADWAPPPPDGNMGI